MIKRLFYKHEHAERDGPSDSSSSSDSELEAEATEVTEEEEDDVVAEVRESKESCSSSSGYESEESSANDVDLDSSGIRLHTYDPFQTLQWREPRALGFPTNNDDMRTGNDGQFFFANHSSDKSNAEIVDTQCNTEAEEDAIPSDVPDCVLKCKSVYKCRLCPRIVCLTEETLRTHLKSKRHARSEKLLSEGRLKLMLNSDGEIEGETHQERHASTLAAAQSCLKSANSGKKNKGRQRQRKRLRKKMGEDLTLENTRQLTKNPAKKRRKSDN